MDQKYHTAINWLERSQITKILEDYGFACYDSESTEELRSALRENILDGTISKSVISDLADGIEADRKHR